MSNTTGTVWMTAAALAALEAELLELEQREDADPVRLIELRDLIRRAETSPKPDDGLVEPGMKVTVRFGDDAEAESFLLGSRELVRQDHDVDLDVYSPESPLGVAITGHYVGDSVTYKAPSGTEIRVTIVAAAPFA